MFTRPHILLVSRGRNDAVMDFIQLVANGSLVFRLLPVYADDQVMRRFLALVVRVVAVTK